MVDRLSKINVGKGDSGMTELANGTPVEKDCLRIMTIGAIDELRSCIAVVLAHGATHDIRDCLSEVQQILIEIALQIGSPGQQRITAEETLILDRSVERFNSQLGSAKEFILPGGSVAAAACLVARAVCRRTECHIVSLCTTDPGQNETLVPFFNRLSDLLMIVSRMLSKGK